MVTIPDVPKPGVLDVLHSASKAIVSSCVPNGGEVLAEVVFGHILQAPISRRTIEWMNAIKDGVEDLQRRQFNIEDLQNNDQFISTLLQATSSAIRTHQKEKLAALRNAVLNTALSFDVDEAMLGIAMLELDKLSPLHFKVLAFLDNPIGEAGLDSWGDMVKVHGKAVEHHDGKGGVNTYFSIGQIPVMESVIPELKGRADVQEYLISDLHHRGLAFRGFFDILGSERTRPTLEQISDTELFVPCATSLGKCLLRLIKDPTSE